MNKIYKHRSLFLLTFLLNFGFSQNQYLSGQNNPEEINNGFVFIDGKYIEAPYKVVLHNSCFLINGNLIFKIPELRPEIEVNFNPITPNYLSKETTIYDYLSIKWDNYYSIYYAKLVYLFNHNSKEIAKQKIIEYLKSLPFVKNVEIDSNVTLRITDYHNNYCRLDICPPENNLTIVESKEEKKRLLEEMIQIYWDRLNKGDCFFFFENGTEISMSFRKSIILIPQVLNILMDNTRTIESKLKSLIGINLFPDDSKYSFLTLIENFQPNQNLENRINKFIHLINERPHLKSVEKSFNNNSSNSTIANKNDFIQMKSLTTSFSPKGTFFYVYSPAAFDWFAFPSHEYQHVGNLIKDQNYLVTTAIFRDLTSNDNDFGSCSTENFINCRDAAFLYVPTHGNEEALAGVFLKDYLQVGTWLTGTPGMEIKYYSKYNMYFAYVLSDWFTSNWKPSLTQSNAISIISACHSAPNIIQSIGGGVCFGYTNTTDFIANEYNNYILLKRMNGSFNEGNYRSAKSAFQLGWFMNGFSMEGNGNITLCPATDKFDPKNGDKVATNGIGYFMVDTYCRDNMPATEALTFEIDPPGNATIDNIKWESLGGNANKITYKWHSQENGSFKITATAHADKIASGGVAFGVHHLDGDRKTPNGDNVVYTFTHAGPSICYILDRSGSMEGAPLANAKSAAIQGIYSMNIGDEVSVVSFAASSSVNYSRHEISGAAERQAAMNAVNSLNAVGATSIGAGLLTGYNQLLNSERKTRNYVLLTDGDENRAPWIADVIHLFQNLKEDTVHHIHTIAFGQGANQQQMAEIARLTGGLYAYSPTQNDPLAIMNIFNTIQNEISGGQTLSKEKNSFSGIQFFTYDAYIDSTISEKRITLIWDNINENIEYELITPTNQEVNENNWTTFPGITYVSGPGIKYYTLKSQEIGSWKANISSTDPNSTTTYALVQTAFSTLKMETNFDKQLYSIYEPIQITAELLNIGDAVIGSEILVDISTPSEKEIAIIQMKRELGVYSEILYEDFINNIEAKCKGLNDHRGITSLILFDDGNHGDEEPNDGIYSNWFKQAESEGTYSFNISAIGELAGIPYSRIKSTDIYIEYAEYVKQIVALPMGWSGISSSVVPYNSDLDQIMSNPITYNNLLYMQSDSGIYIPNHVNEIRDWNYMNGYKVKMEMSEQIDIYGPNFTTNRIAPLKKGINLLPVLTSFPVSSDEVFGEMSKNLKFAYDIYSGEVFCPAGDLYSLQNLLPGKAYLVGVYNDCEVIYPQYPVNSSSINYEKHKPPEYKNAPIEYINTGIPHIISIQESAIDNIKMGDLIIVNTTEDVCCGMSEYLGDVGNLALIAFGDDYITQEKDGFYSNEYFNIKLYRSSNNKYYPLKVTYNHLMPNSERFEEYGLSVITAIDVGDYGNNDEFIVKVYPNPFTDETIIEVPNKQGNSYHFRIYNSSGMLIKEVTDINSSYIIFQREDLRGGIYFIEFIGEQIYTGKMIIY